MTLRPYQYDLFKNVRIAFRDNRAVLMQLATGAGKTIIFAEMTKSSTELNKVIWIIVPRNELLKQASEALLKLNVPHGLIAAGHKESKAFSVHIVSKDTLIRRYDKIKTIPDFIIIDECHLAIDRYLEIVSKYPTAKILGVTATPERLDGRGLSEIYNELVEGPTLAELIEQRFLTSVKYFCPPAIGIEKLSVHGTEFNINDLSKFLEEKKIYGNAINHYRKHADGKPCLIYCRSVKLAEETAHKFSYAGYDFENIDGTMNHKKRKVLIDALRENKINGLTSCDLITYGLDVPRVECIIMLRPTLSRALFCQMVGRGLRPFFLKNECVILDHVGNYQEHGHPLAPYEWNFYGTEKRKRKKRDPELNLKLCPQLDYLYCDKKSCAGCEYNTRGVKERVLKIVETDLKEAPSPIKLSQRPHLERREIIDKINLEVSEYENTGNMSGPVGELLKIAYILGHKPTWVYQILSIDRKTVNITLLHEIARQKNFKPGWVYFQRKQINLQLRRKKAKDKNDEQF